jgi:hypothetical protein
MTRDEILQDDKNYRVVRTKWQGKDALRKTVKSMADEQRQKIFHNEITGMQAYRALATGHIAWRLTIPEVFEEGSDYVTREFIDGEELLTLDITRDDAKSRIVRLAEVLANIDQIEPEQAYKPNRDSAPYTDIRRRFDSWSEAPLEAAILSSKDFAAANALIKEYQPYLEPRYAHGDMSPFKHVYLLPNNRVGFIDFEHFSPQKARYYDVAYAYTRIFTRAKYPEIAGDLLQYFLDVSEAAPHKTEQLLAILTQRAIGMHFDAYNDRQKGEDYVDRAQLLLRLCLSRNLTSLADINGVLRNA